MGPIGTPSHQQSNNGRVWVDGVFKGQRTIASDVDIDALFLNIYHGGTKLAKQPIHYRLAAACIATKYIGVPTELRSGIPLAMPPIDRPWQTVDRFDVSPPSVVAGGSALLTWRTRNASEVLLDGTRVADSGTMTVKRNASHNFLLKAIGNGPPINASAALTIEPGRIPGSMAWRKKWRTPVGTFAEMPGTGLNNMMPSNVRPPAGTIDAYCGLGAGPASWWATANGGHADSSDNGVYAIDFTDDDPAWRVIRPPSASTARTTPAEGSLPYYHDGLPASRHTYLSQVYCKPLNRIIMPFSNALWYTAGSANNMDGFPVNGVEWDPRGSYADCIVNGPPSATVAVHPDSGDIYVGFYGKAWAKWMCATNRWSSITVNGPRGYFGGIIDAKRNRLIMACPTTAAISALPFFDLTTLVDSALETGISMPDKVGQRTLTHDTQNDIYYLFAHGGPSGQHVYSIHPDTGKADELKQQLPAVSSQGVWNRFVYFGEPINGVMYYPRWTSNIWFMATGPVGTLERPSPQSASQPVAPGATPRTMETELPTRIRDHPRFGVKR
jgi:hypothetical protein